MKMDLMGVFLALTLLSYAVSAADLHSSNSYYTRGAVVSEGVNVHNADYASAIGISPDILFEVFAGCLDSDKAGSIADGIVIDKAGNSLSAGFEISAENLHCGGIVLAGCENYAIMSYDFNSGRSQTFYSNPITSVSEEIAADGCLYQSEFATSSRGVYSTGNGIPIEDKNGFEHDISMKHANKLCKIESYLFTSEDKSSAGCPLDYYWSASVGSNGYYAETGINLEVAEGNRDAEFQLKGTSSELDDKYAPVGGSPAQLEAVDEISPFYSLSVSKDLYMKYEIAS